MARGSSASVARGTSKASWRISAPGQRPGLRCRGRGRREASSREAAVELEGAEERHQAPPFVAALEPFAALASAKRRHDLLGEEAEAVEHVGLGDDLHRVQQEVHAVDSHRLPPLERADDALRAAERQPLAGLLAGVGAGGLAPELGQEAQRLVGAARDRPRGRR